MATGSGLTITEYMMMLENSQSHDWYYYYSYNFALAFLKSSATANLPHVGTVCLPPAGFVASAGASCVFSGWGTDSAQKIINQLTETEVPMMEHSTCEERLRQSPLLGPGFQLLESLTCAGGEVGKDICAAGGGSPLVCPIEGQNRYVQTGIVSWVMEGCGVDGSPVVFADVAVARPWIDQQMAVRVYSTASTPTNVFGSSPTVNLSLDHHYVQP
ncbi:hypothetical protein ABMA27_012767 [Loxostege sticticalis]|uniref:Peptidase S1 domain-containing protein n=1 Tax=Loxostege sticticalis TaxID=481309 RepID=A0ABR3GZY9_LOXSC